MNVNYRKKLATLGMVGALATSGLYAQDVFIGAANVGTGNVLVEGDATVNGTLVVEPNSPGAIVETPVGTPGGAPLIIDNGDGTSLLVTIANVVQLDRTSTTAGGVTLTNQGNGTFDAEQVEVEEGTYYIYNYETIDNNTLATVPGPAGQVGSETAVLGDFVLADETNPVNNPLANVAVDLVNPVDESTWVLDNTDPDYNTEVTAILNLIDTTVTGGDVQIDGNGNVDGVLSIGLGPDGIFGTPDDSTVVVEDVAAALSDNASDIVSNQTDIVSNQTDIVSNQTDIASNQGDIVSNQTDIVSNQGDIVSNQTDIVSNQGDIVSNQTDIVSNQGDIVSNQTDIVSNQGDIVSNQTDIVSNQGDIVSNQTDIVSNQGDIVSNQTDIVSNQGDIVSNQTDIVSNQGDIVSNQTDIVSNQGDIVSNQTDIAAEVATRTALIRREADGVHVGMDSFVLDDLDPDGHRISVSDSDDLILGGGVNNTAVVVEGSSFTVNTASTFNADVTMNGNLALGSVPDVETYITSTQAQADGNTAAIGVNASNIARNSGRISRNSGLISENRSMIQANSAAIGKLQNDLDDVETKAYAGIAAAATLDSIVSPSEAGKTSVTAGVAFYEGEAAGGVNATHRFNVSEEQDMYVNGGVAVTSDSTVLGRLLLGAEF